MRRIQTCSTVEPVSVSVRLLLWNLVPLVCIAGACRAAATRPGPVVCEAEGLFGAPTAQTGLNDSQCSTSCACSASGYQAPVAYPEPPQWQLDNAPSLLTADPYRSALSPFEEKSFPSDDAAGFLCILERTDAEHYRTRTVPRDAVPNEHNIVVTHGGHCGLCSSLQDLGVYLRQPNLTEPVRRCGIVGLNDGDDAARRCIEAIGFSEACAQIWAMNTKHTREQCLEPCLAALSASFNEPDGSLNACLQCDEDESGPVFKRFAGRTRRNSGIATSICRPCSGVERINHAYLNAWSSDG